MTTDVVTVPIRTGLSWAGIYMITCVACEATTGGWTLTANDRSNGRDATLTCGVCQHRQRHALIYPEFVDALAAADGEATVDAIAQWIPHRRVEGEEDPTCAGMERAVYWRAWDNPEDGDWWREHWQELIDVSVAAQAAREEHPDADTDDVVLTESARRHYRELSERRESGNIEAETYKAFTDLAELHLRNLPEVTTQLAELATDQELPEDALAAVRNAHRSASQGDARTAHGHLAGLGIDRILQEPELDKVGLAAAKLGMMFPR